MLYLVSLEWLEENIQDEVGTEAIAVVIAAEALLRMGAVEAEAGTIP